MIPRSFDQSISVIHPVSLSLAAVSSVVSLLCKSPRHPSLLLIHLDPLSFLSLHQPNLIRTLPFRVVVGLIGISKLGPSSPFTLFRPPSQEQDRLST